MYDMKICLSHLGIEPIKDESTLISVNLKAFNVGARHYNP
jgi:hypothetical protein